MRAKQIWIRRHVGAALKNSLRWVLNKIKPTKPQDGAESGKVETKSVSRKHVIELDAKSGLVSLMGGKWTSYRKMGVDTVKYAVENNAEVLKPKYEETQTLNFNLIGSYANMELFCGLTQSQEALEKQYVDHMVHVRDIPRNAAKNLFKAYGTACLRVVELGEKTNTNTLLVETEDATRAYLKSQVLYAMQAEMAVKPNDILCRRIPIAFEDSKIAE